MFMSDGATFTQAIKRPQPTSPLADSPGDGPATDDAWTADRYAFLPPRENQRRPALAKFLERARKRPYLSQRQIRAMLDEEAAHGHFFLFVPVLAGAGAAFWFTIPREPALWSVLSLLVICGAAAILTDPARRLLRLAALGPSFFLAGMTLAQLETWRSGTLILDSPVTTLLTGVVERREIDGEGRWRYIVRVEKTEAPELRRPPRHVALLARARHDPLEPSQRISGRVRISPPSGPALVGLNDFGFSSYFDGLGAIGFFYGAPKKEQGHVGADGLAAGAARWLFDLRGSIAGHIRHTVPGDAGAFAAAIVTDERRAISKDTTEALRLAGLAHIIAISGLNMALAAGIFFVGARTALSLFTGFAQTYPVKKIAAAGALVMATAYYSISGFGVSAERAYIMMVVMLIAVFFDRPSISLRNVALSAMIILVISPSEVLGPSFQMSFSATTALVAGYAIWTRRGSGHHVEPALFNHPLMRPLRGSWNFVVGVLVTSLIGSISTAIFAVEHFHRIATYGLVANLAAMPIISFVVMPAGLVGMLLMPLGLEGPALWAMGLGLEAVIAIAKEVAAWGGDVAVGRQHAWFLGMSSAGFLLLTLLRTRLRLAGVPLLVVALLLSWQERSRPPPDVLISEDASLVALIDPEGRIATNRIRPPGFIFDQWRRALILGEPVAPRINPGKDTSEDQLQTGMPHSRRPGLTPQQISAATTGIEEAPTGRFVCVARVWCAARTRKGTIIVTVEDSRYAGVACDVADLVVAPRARFNRCRSGAIMLNAAVLRKLGALEISLNDTADGGRWNISASVAGKDRAWHHHRQFDWRSGAFTSVLPPPLDRLVSDNGG